MEEVVLGVVVLASDLGAEPGLDLEPVLEMASDLAAEPEEALGEAVLVLGLVSDLAQEVLAVQAAQQSMMCKSSPG